MIHDLTLDLAGPVALSDRMGVDRTPSSQRGRAILAMLATARHYTRSRAELQDKLWSEKDPELGAQSLRQELYKLRQALGPWRERLSIDRHRVRLDPAGVRVILTPEQAPQSEADLDAVTFATGLDVPDPEFEHWLRDQRVAFETRLEEGRLAAMTESSDLPLRLVLDPGEDLTSDVSFLFGQAFQNARPLIEGARLQRGEHACARSEGMVVVGLERRLFAVLVADVVGYSRLMRLDEEGTHNALASHRRDFINPKIAEFHGRIVNVAGDAALIVFASLVDAVRCAVEIQNGMARRILLKKAGCGWA